MSSEETTAQRSPHGVATLASGGLLDSGACLQCGQAIPRPRKGQRACSGRCRWKLWEAGQQTAAQARDRKVREYILTAEESLQAAKRLVEEGKGEK